MTDKVQKIKEWISKTQDGLMDDNGNFDNPSDEGAFHILTNLDYYIDSMQEEPVSDDLEEACEQLAENARKHKAETLSPFFSQTDYKQGVIDGAEWKKQQMMKDAVDGVVHRFDGDRLAAIHYNDPKGVPMCYYASASGLEVGNKVKLILAKED